MHSNGACAAGSHSLGTSAWCCCTAGGMRRWQAVVEALEGLDTGGAGSAVVDALQTKQGKATVFMADTLLYVDMRRRRLRWSIKLPHLTTVTTHGAEPVPEPAAPLWGGDVTVASSSHPGTNWR
jgi:hypothetical protein